MLCHVYLDMLVKLKGACIRFTFILRFVAIAFAAVLNMGVLVDNLHPRHPSTVCFNF